MLRFLKQPREIFSIVDLLSIFLFAIHQRLVEEKFTLSGSLFVGLLLKKASFYHTSCILARLWNKNSF